jgi:hypothetical protein
VLRLPVFAGVGRLGLPLVAAATGVALWSTSWAMAASGPAKGVSVAMPQQAPVRATAGQVGVSIPSVVFGQADGLASLLGVGQHTATVQVWLAAGSPASVATVRSSDGAVHGCSAVRLRAASVNTLHCAVDVASTARAVTLTVATSVAGQHFQTSYAHRVR